MAIREFADAGGRVWQAWDTVPTTPHETQLFRRSAQIQTDAGDGEGQDDADRTGTAQRFTQGREHGWLTFATGEEKRRLSPIPPDWSHASDAELADWLDQAEPVHLSQAAIDLLARGARRERGQ